MNYLEIKRLSFELIDKLEKSSVTKVCIAFEDTEITVEKATAPAPRQAAQVPPQVAQTEPSQPDKSKNAVPSPMVGTFYRASSPDAKPFVEVGDTVNTGDTVCIIEAMKLMNEIASDRSGTVREILIGNGDVAEFGQPLMIIE